MFFGKKKSEKGEMPFLDHLEELRWRILWSLLALVVGSFIGYYVVQRFDVVSIIKIPIEPHLTDGVLVFTRPIDAFLIVLKLSILCGFILSFPVITSQAWRFFSPALYEHERKYITPAMIAAVGLFAAGAMMAYLWVLPAALNIMLGPRFVGPGLQPMITAGEYFAFATSFIVAFGLVFELPLIQTMLATLGLVSPQFFARHRQYAVLAAAIVSAFVTPPDAFTMIMMMIPILVLYEVGIGVGRLVWKKDRRNPSIGG
jgi:sec-independent protein translocase protein TatC